MGPYERLVRPLLFRAAGRDPEQIHERTLNAIAAVGANPPLHAALAAWYSRHSSPRLVAGIRFPGLVGLAAGMDKNGVALHSWSALGFGHAEFGTVTAQAQAGNPRPRLFRLSDSTALLNRMGFNNDGALALADRLRAAGVRRGNRALGLVVGVSIGKTKASPLEEAAADYEVAAQVLAPYADYLAVNVSSPNTPGLRTLQDATSLGEILQMMARAAGEIPVFVKIAPDLTEPALEELLEVCEAGGAAGLIATNTTLSRTGIADADRWRVASPGGISGAPLTARARAVVGFLRCRTELPIIGVGGLLQADDGRAMLDAGADLLQVYTGFVYRGPTLVRELNALGGAHP